MFRFRETYIDPVKHKGVAVSGSTWRIIQVSKWLLVTMVASCLLRIGLWDPFQIIWTPWLINGGDPITTYMHWEPILQVWHTSKGFLPFNQAYVPITKRWVLKSGVPAIYGPGECDSCDSATEHSPGGLEPPKIPTLNLEYPENHHFTIHRNHDLWIQHGGHFPGKKGLSFSKQKVSHGILHPSLKFPITQ